MMMKKDKLLMLLPLLMGWLMVAGMASCSDDDSPSVDPEVDELNAPWEQYDLNDIEIVDSGSINLKEVCSNTISYEKGKNDDMDSVLVGYASLLLDSLTTYENHLIDSLQSVEGGNSGEALWFANEYLLQLSWISFNYKSVSATGEPITLSALLVYPKELKESKSWFNPDKAPLNNYYIGTHVTITSNDECPTRFHLGNLATDVGLLALFASSLFKYSLVVLPDYEGYGVTMDRPHPYLNREVTAKQVIDAAKAGLQFFNSTYKKDGYTLHSNWKSVSVGYSQGGATSAATYRYALEHSAECSSLRMAGAICGDGPYDPVATLNSYIKANRMYMPVAVALMMKGMCDTDPDMIREGCTVADFCTPGFINTGIFESIASKKKDTNSIGIDLLNYSFTHDDFTMMRNMSGAHAKPGEPTIGMTQPYKKTIDDLYVNQDKGGYLKWDKGPRDSWCEMDQALNEDCINFLRDGTITNDKLRRKLRALLKCMRRNQLFYGDNGNWIPSANAKFTFFHSVADEVVPYDNMTSVHSVWTSDRGKYISFEYEPSAFQKILGSFKGDKDPTKKDWAAHGKCGAMFFLGKARGLAEEIVDNKWSSGEVDDDGVSTFAYIAAFIEKI